VGVYFEIGSIALWMMSSYLPVKAAEEDEEDANEL
jgi:hypothetical protein